MNANLQEFLFQLGINVVSSAVYDTLTQFFQKNPTPTIEKLNKEMQRYLNIENAEIAAKVINFLAKKGDLIISGTNITAGDFIRYQSSKNTQFEIKGNSSSSTNHTSIEVGAGVVRGAGGASIKQSNKGITFEA